MLKITPLISIDPLSHAIEVSCVDSIGRERMVVANRIYPDIFSLPVASDGSAAHFFKVVTEQDPVWLVYDLTGSWRYTFYFSGTSLNFIEPVPEEVYGRAAQQQSIRLYFNDRVTAERLQVLLQTICMQQQVEPQDVDTLLECLRGVVWPIANVGVAARELADAV